MSYWIIKTSCNILCDFRPRLECPQWYYERNRAFKFATAAEAREFWRASRKKHELDQHVRFVRVVSLKERHAERAALRAVVEQAAELYEIERDRAEDAGDAQAENFWCGHRDTARATLVRSTEKKEKTT